uniref:Uncharacterized protein n=1 Tax=Anguilla anguilla TaxID=7936 RepID=A0A0E9P6W9_ANGAN
MNAARLLSCWRIKVSGRCSQGIRKSLSLPLIQSHCFLYRLLPVDR